MLAQIAMKQHSRFLRIRISGLTLIEILVGLGVLGILVAVALPSMADLLEKRRVIAAADEVAGMLTYAKAETNATNTILAVRFDPDPSMSCAAVVTTGGLNRCRCNNPANSICPSTVMDQKLLRLFQLPKSYVKFDASAIWQTGQENFIRFSRDQGTMETSNFRVDVVGLKRGYALRIEVNAIGRIKICSPNGDMSGYGACS